MGRVTRKAKTAEAVTKEVDPVEVTAAVVNSIREFREIHAELISFMDEHAEVFKYFYERVSLYNLALDKARVAIQEAPAVPKGIDPEFYKAASGSKRVSYALDKLPAHVKALPGVVKNSVDKTVLEDLLKKKAVAEEDVAAARTVTYDSPSVFVPPQLEFRYKRDV